jgi:hypothetical protein
VALCVIVNLEHMDWLPPEGSFVAPSARRRRPYPAVTDIHETSYHDYGNRVGAFRVMRVLDRYGIRATAAMDAGVASGCPALVRECRKRSWEFIGHGLALSQMITERMPEVQERQHIQRALEAVQQRPGRLHRAGSAWIAASRPARCGCWRRPGYAMCATGPMTSSPTA